MKKRIEKILKEVVDTWHPISYKRKPQLMTYKVVDETKKRIHIEFCVCAGENGGEHDEMLYLYWVNELLDRYMDCFDEAHLFKWEYDVCDDIWYAWISVVEEY